MDAELKERLLEQFRAYLDAEPEPPDEPDQEVDLHTLLNELAVLKNEIRLESRQFKTALDQVRGVATELGEANARLGRELDQARDQTASVRRQAERQLLLELLDLRDRLEAGLAAIAGYRPGWRTRWFGRAALRFLSGLRQGQDLTLQRLDQVLARHRVHAVETVGRSLDPLSMNAVATAFEPERQDGMVLAEQRRGFVREGEVLRYAEVIVNKRIP
jgi:molecular chaperone GrpE